MPARLGEKLRKLGLGTEHVTVFYHTSAHDTDQTAAERLDDRAADRGDQRHHNPGQGG